MSTITEPTLAAPGVQIEPEQPFMQRNVGDLERVASLILGGVAALGAFASLGRKRPLRALLLMALGGDMLYRGSTGYSPVYNALGVTADDATFASNPLSRAITFKESITIMKSPSELYGFWRDFRNLPKVMTYLERVDLIDGTRSHWVAKGPAGFPVEWDAEIVQDEPGETISWRSLEGSEVYNRGSVRFETATAGRGTVITVQLTYRPPAGLIGAAAARLMGRSPAQEIKEDLRHLKQQMETGETPTTEGQPRGACG